MEPWILLLAILFPPCVVLAARNTTIGCRKIRPPSDGGIRYPGLTQEQIRTIEVLPVAYEIEYVCRSNRVIDGPGVRKCLENGTWTHMDQRSRCVRNCSRLALNLENGVVLRRGEVKTRDEVRIPVEGTVVEYRCNAGFKLVGSSRNICTKFGKWNTSKPVCQVDRSWNRQSHSEYTRGRAMVTRGPGIWCWRGPGNWFRDLVLEGARDLPREDGAARMEPPLQRSRVVCGDRKHSRFSGCGLAYVVT
ncbi:gamma-aminobutyric acid type B receptor subunit 1-like [Pristis pectinata]|uniref:gamma-aminobutyric acid type B receptor subunit 1-like n=1 Tax=Pristis pectinata TaxID=685728 RepID=UPI00223D0709|nr:gamma-aminobutyric acid type B receptor subunit 1-like [Pristis pectinata]